MKIIQFRCPIDPPASQLKALMIEQVNTWSRLQRLTTDPEYITKPFSLEQWHAHTQDPALYWADWDAIYAALGDDGQKIADQMLGSGPLQGILRMAPLVAQMPDVKIQIVDVADPLAAGYVEADDAAGSA